MEYNRVEVHICGKRYVLQAQDDAGYIRELAHSLDKRIREIFDADPNVSFTDAVVLVAISILDEGMKANTNIDHIRKQIKSYVEEAAESRMQLEECKRELEQTKQAMDKMKTELDLLALKNKLENGTQNERQ